VLASGARGRTPPVLTARRWSRPRLVARTLGLGVTTSWPSSDDSLFPVGSDPSELEVVLASDVNGLRDRMIPHRKLQQFVVQHPGGCLPAEAITIR
jgi:hypothetical protein